ncbi:MAG: FAD:protein FMN transferase [Nitrospinae bacterium]|nr:FAD:protein FMN transferase [Nitrospinota bacterium]
MHKLFSHGFFALGTECNLHFYAENQDKADQISELAVNEAHRIEDRYSRYNPESFLSHINKIAQAGGSVEVDSETAGLLDYAYACHEASGGLFDITSGILRRAWNFESGKLPDREQIESLLPKVGLDKITWTPPELTFNVPGMELDFGGIGKEYAADRVAELLESSGVRHGLVDLGGDIAITGPHANGEPWEIEIRRPLKEGPAAGTIKLGAGALASSGDYERCIVINGVRYGHILNPRTGWPSRGLASVSVVADKCVVAGSICTIAMLKGQAGAGWMRDIAIQHFYIDENGNEAGTLEL